MFWKVHLINTTYNAFSGVPEYGVPPLLAGLPCAVYIQYTAVSQGSQP